MPLEKENCGDCGAKRNACPECGSTFVTPMDNPQKRKPTSMATHGPYGEVEYKHVCWDCPWSEKIRVTIERLNTEDE